MSFIHFLCSNLLGKMEDIPNMLDIKNVLSVQGKIMFGDHYHALLTHQASLARV